MLSSSKKYDTKTQANQVLNDVIGLLIDSSSYAVKKQSGDDRWYFNVVDTSGKIIARRIEYFAAEQDCIDEIQRVRSILINQNS